jgi:hypothetical protein
MSERVPAETVVLGQLDRLLASATFRKARTAKVLLDLLVIGTLKGAPPSEQELGIKLFNRPDDWVPGSEDAIVRVNTSRLNERLAEYYASEGASDPLRVSIVNGEAVFTLTGAPPSASCPNGIATSALAKTLEAYFGEHPRCVVTGEAASWQHLDGDTNTDALGNLIPLCERLRSHIDDLRRGRKTTNILELEPRYLLETLARQHFADWRIADACACAHLAFHMSEPPFGAETADFRVLCLCDTLSHARHRFNESMVAYIIRNRLLPLVAPLHCLDPRPMCLLALQLSGLLDEVGCFDSAAGALALAESVANRFASLVYQPESLNRFSLMRRRAQLLMERQPADKAFAALANEIEEQMANNANLPLTWQVVTTARAFRQGTYRASRQAYETLIPIAERFSSEVFSGRSMEKPRRIDFSNLSQLFLFSSIATSRVCPGGWEDYALEMASKAERLSQETGFALPPEFWTTVSEDTFDANPPARKILQLASRSVMPRLRQSARTDIETILSCLNHMLIVGKDDDALRWRSPWSASPIHRL